MIDLILHSFAVGVAIVGLVTPIVAFAWAIVHLVEIYQRG